MFSDKIINIPEKRKKNFESGFHILKQQKIENRILWKTNIL